MQGLIQYISMYLKLYIFNLYILLFRSSLNDCKQALKLKPQYTKVLNRAAHCYLKVKDFTQCLEFCDQILKESPNDKSIIDLKSQAIKDKVNRKESNFYLFK